MNLTRINWPLGWIPSSDATNGSPDGLLRMDNLQQDEDGSLALVRPIKRIATGFANYISDIYSKVIGSNGAVWLGLGINGTQALRSLKGDFTDTVTVIDQGGQRIVFGDCLGQVLVCAGGIKKRKDNGTTVLPLGIKDPTAGPIFSVNNQPNLALDNGTRTVIEGDGATNPPFVIVDSTTLRAVVLDSYGGDKDALNFGDGPADDPNKDTFSLVCQLQDDSFFKKIRIEVILDNVDDPKDYYWFEWFVADGQFNMGASAQSTLKCLRGQFIRQGSDSTLDWTKVKGMNIIAEALVEADFYVTEQKFTGGAKGQLYGFYEYIQVDVADNGIYLAKSIASPKSEGFYVLNGNVNVQPENSTDPQVTEYWIFRRSISIASADPKLLPIISAVPNTPVLLDQFYRIGVSTDGGPIVDTMSDLEALQLNIKANLFLKSLDTLSDEILGIEGLYNEIMLYMTLDKIYLSDRLNPDAIDQRFTIKAFGDPTEKNLWLRKISNQMLVLMTTKDLYEITGTLLENPDGSLDVNIIPIGEAYPALSADCAAVDGSIFYAAADGVRVTSGTNSISVSQMLKLLYQGLERHGVPPVAILPNNNGRYSLAVGKTHLYATVPMQDGSRRLFVMDMIKKTWRLQFTDPFIVHVTQTDKVLVAYSEPGGGNQFAGLFELDAPVRDDDEADRSIFFQTVYDHNQQPRNRKDAFTLKVVADTGARDVDVYVGKDGGSFALVGTVNSSGQSTKYFTLTNVTLGFRYAIKLVDRALLRTFHLYELTLEYEPRPEQVNYLRIPNNNLGTQSRKRFISYGFVIDCLGNAVTFTPFVDNVAGGSSAVTTPVKLTNIHFFTSETLGTDIGGILQSDNSANPFEFYGLNTEEIISEKLPAPTKFLIIPANDYGNPNRKRFTSYKLQVNSRNASIKLTPRIDGVNYAPQNFTTSEKRTIEYFFDTSLDVTGIDIGGTLESNANTPFEFYGVVVPQDIEVLPPRLRSFVIPSTNYGTPNRKRHTSYKFEINTNGEDVLFTPYLDGVAHTARLFNTTERRTVEYFFDIGDGDVIGIDVAGLLQAQTDSAFEFYKVVIPEKVEQLPPRLEYFRIPNTNYGVAAKKRLRTIPIVIDTYGKDVRFIPVIDGTPGTPSTHNTIGKKTVFHYFETDVFCTDIGGVLQSIANPVAPFEFYQLEQPENVETLPVGKKYDQVGPSRFDKIGKLFHFRVRLISGGDTTIPYTIYGETDSTVDTYTSNPLYSGTIPVVSGIDNIWEVQLPKSINSQVFRITFGPTEEAFHRYDCLLRVSPSGMETDAKWVPVR